MALALARSRSRCGVHAQEVLVEVYLGGGMQRMTVVGPPAAVEGRHADEVAIKEEPRDHEAGDRAENPA